MYVCLWLSKYLFPAHRGVCFVLIIFWTDAKAKTKLVPQRALTNNFRKYSQSYYYIIRFGFKQPWSIWKMLPEIIDSFLKIETNANIPIVPFCNIQIVMNICIFLHLLCVVYVLPQRNAVKTIMFSWFLSKTQFISDLLQNHPTIVCKALENLAEF